MNQKMYGIPLNRNTKEKKTHGSTEPREKRKWLAWAVWLHDRVKAHAQAMGLISSVGYVDVN